MLSILPFYNKQDLKNVIVEYKEFIKAIKSHKRLRMEKS